MRGSEFARLRAFAAVVEEQNFARAAARLRIAPPTLSQMIRELEEALGVRLLNRTTRSLSLTAPGQKLLVRLKPAMAEMQAAMEDAASLSDKPAGLVKLHTPAQPCAMLIEPLLGAFHAAYPDIVLDITVDDAVTNIVEGGFDAGIRIGELLEQDMVAIRLTGDMRQIAVAAPAYLARHGVPETPGDLLAHRCINWRPPGRSGIYNWEFGKEGRWFAVAVGGPLLVSHREVALQAALQGVGIAFWSEHILRPYIQAGQLVPLLEEFSPSFPGWHLYYPSQRYLPGAVRAFVDFCRDHAVI
ncbi:LysR family transcriptional regulator [Acidocella aminolytica]|jgi:DNA-binding transcriptional LysR family regulator|uniref:Transcriptional regulator LysR n=1 Tax=Acidocella aminolytica 101 = DSM 11237 TaxID=1120923 RepID=A0A0D6PHJ2_9PROT|nr:LysR family transcriptional regulator [Acidocella aminolytica]GAN80846.1 transcriptional regulator LysR [Acidocella aminolytica 101 = DSM 11237]GBQ32575.1 transcriptional regulator [Acidocella aminolytica 101 = DSM 11237]SHE31938.1 DNA-binding transcriptional regulator, LysR family [Acidocella aminolytica 101 = DSM 11237]